MADDYTFSPELIRKLTEGICTNADGSRVVVVDMDELVCPVCGAHYYRPHTRMLDPQGNLVGQECVVYKPVCAKCKVTSDAYHYHFFTDPKKAREMASKGYFDFSGGGK